MYCSKKYTPIYVGAHWQLIDLIRGQRTAARMNVIQRSRDSYYNVRTA